MTAGSAAATLGLCAGDALVRLDDVDLQTLRHKEALDLIAGAGNHFQLSVLR